jgi:Tfp pilus assembly protein PilV
MAEEIVKLTGAVEVTESGGNRMKTQGAFHIQLANGDASLLRRPVDCKHPVPSGATDRDGRASLNRGGRSSTAFTLHEVLVSVFLGAMMLTALYAAFTFGFSTVKTEREDLRATQILVEQMEGLRLIPYASLQAFTTNAYFDPADQTNGTGGAYYTITITTNAPAASDLAAPGTFNPTVWYASSMLKITATATWTNSNMVRTRILNTYAAKNGIQGYVYAPK